MCKELIQLKKVNNEKWANNMEIFFSKENIKIVN